MYAAASETAACVRIRSAVVELVRAEGDERVADRIGWHIEHVRMVIAHEVWTLEYAWRIAAALGLHISVSIEERTAGDG